MKIIVDNSGEYNDVMGNYFNLSKYDDGAEDVVFFQGYNTSRNVGLKQQYACFKKRIYLNLESPCSFLTTQSSVEEQKYFTHIFTLCPYTAEWLKDTNTNFIVVPFPISLDVFNKVGGDKEFDVIYMGTLMNHDHYNIINVMRNHNYVFTSLFNYSTPYTPTHLNVNSFKKWELLAKSRINITINQAPFGIDKVGNVKSYLGWEKHRAFNKIDSGTMPQIKVRITEAMGLKTLNLVKRDEWNVIEHWFEPDKHFIYWDDFNDLNNKITDIKNNYEQYQHIIDNAYDAVKPYDIDSIFKDKILKWN